jgi:hypothetical protein
MPGPPVNSQTGGQSAYPVNQGAQQVPNGFQQPGNSTGPPNQAAQLINQILTTPRPGGLAGLQQQQQAGQQMLGGSGIAGFASTAEGAGIMVYHDHTNYEEWEFLFDPTKIKPLPNPNQGAVGTPVNQIGSGFGNQNQNTQPTTPTPPKQ